MSGLDVEKLQQELDTIYTERENVGLDLEAALDDLQLLSLDLIHVPVTDTTHIYAEVAYAQVSRTQASRCAG